MMSKLEDYDENITITKAEIEWLVIDKFPNNKMWDLFKDRFFADFLIKNKILVQRYCEEVADEYADTISRLDEDEPTNFMYYNNTQE